MVEVSIAGGQHAIERLGLRHGAREAVEDKAVRAIRLGDPRCQHLDNYVVGNELAGFHDHLDSRSERAARDNRGSQHVAGRELHDPVRLFEPLRLSALASARRPKKDQVHQRRPLSRAFLISPSY
jgi:hypothetical protein